LVLEYRNQVILRRGRRGKVLSAHFYGDARQPLRCNLATKYTKRETIAGSYKLIQHKPLPYRAADAAHGFTATPAQIDLLLRCWFGALVQSSFAICK